MKIVAGESLVPGAGPTVAARLVPITSHSYPQLEAAFPRLASLFSSASWAEALRLTYGFESKAVIGYRGSELASAALFAEIDDIRGRRLVSLPFSDYVDPFAASADEWRPLLDRLVAERVPVRLRLLHNNAVIGTLGPDAHSPALWHGVSLAGEEDELWARLAPGARQNIRKAERSGLTVREGRTLRDVALFYDLHLAVRKRKYRLLAQPMAFFENLHQAFAPGNRIVVLLAERDGVPVAGTFFLIHGDTLYYKFNASRDLDARPNDLLAWRGIQLGRRLGLRLLDFGLSSRTQPGLVRFKEKFATATRPIIELRLSPDQPDHARTREVEHLLGRLTEILTAPNVPDDLTRTAGDELYRFFS